MTELSQYLNTFIALFAVSNPIGNLPIYLGLTAAKSVKEQKQTIRTASLAFVIILLISLVMGQAILAAFGISIASFRVAGGFLIFLMGFHMLQAKTSQIAHTKEENEEAQTASSIAVVPLAIPLLAGPGTISSVIVFAHNTQSWGEKIGLAIVILVLAGLIFISYSFAPAIGQLLGKTGMNIVTRIMGLITMAIAVEFMADGLSSLFPGWK
ncbi:YchE family NAAT transporter [Crocosphaera sp. UHCC 0190]|uniref:YchE family NAAT transporter n=1 Tax=Crocosphaera sp. UHCC 0190 TaxID=3110246 RepID=UPI002B1EBE28|nr:YchE family NAAT transporter [Crocosphaera sp. UHCC 0190]MEA5511896.1 YchE family NAAT transporter [Crocosphaera sp. UHCC 0190]